MKKYLIVVTFIISAIAAMVYHLPPDLLGIGLQAPPMQTETESTHRPSKRMSGRSGTAFSPAPGLFVTNHHVVEDCISITGVHGNRRFPVKVVTMKKDRDLALLRSDAPNSRFVGTVPISMQDTLAMGKLGYIAGFSGNVLAIKEAKILQPNRSVPFIINGENGRPMKKKLQVVTFQTTAYHGDSGAPLVNTAGRVVAIVSRGLKRKEGKKETKGAAVRLDQLRTLLAPYTTVYSTNDFNVPNALSRSARDRLLNATIQLRCRLL